MNEAGYLRNGPLEKLWGGGGNFPAAGIFLGHSMKFF